MFVYSQLFGSKWVSYPRLFTLDRRGLKNIRRLVWSRLLFRNEPTGASGKIRGPTSSVVSENTYLNMKVCFYSSILNSTSPICPLVFESSQWIFVISVNFIYMKVFLTTVNAHFELVSLTERTRNRMVTTDFGKKSALKKPYLLPRGWVPPFISRRVLLPSRMSNYSIFLQIRTDSQRLVIAHEGIIFCDT